MIAKTESRGRTTSTRSLASSDPGRRPRTPTPDELRREAKLRNGDEQDPVDRVQWRVGDLDHGDVFITEFEHAPACPCGRVVDSLRKFDAVESRNLVRVAMGLTLETLSATRPEFRLL